MAFGIFVYRCFWQSKFGKIQTMNNNRTIVKFWGILLPNIVLLYLALWLSILIRYNQPLDLATRWAHIEAFSLIFAMWLVVLFIHGLFEVEAFRRFSSLIFNLVSAMAANLLL